MQITLVIPCYNEESAIGPCLDAVVAQTRQFDEILVVDNNSTDGTRAVVEQYVDKLPIRVLSESRQGVAWASQHGYDMACGDVIARIDADTRMERSWAAVVEEYLSTHSEIDGVGGFCWFYDMSFLSMRKGAFARAEKFGAESSGPRRMLGGNNMAIRRSAWVAAKTCVKNLPGTHEDIDLTYALLDTGSRLSSLPGMLVGLSPRRYMVSPKSLLREMVAVLRTQHAHGRQKDAIMYAVYMPFNLVVASVLGLVARRGDASREDRVSPVTR